MLGRITRWALVAVAGVLTIGLVGAGVVYAQGPVGQGTPPTSCPGPQGGAGRNPLGAGKGPLGAGKGWGGSMPQAWADALGIKLEELTAAVQSGKSVLDLAKEKGLTVEALVEKAIAARKTVLQEAVDAGCLTQAQADTMLGQMRTRITENLQNGTCTPGANCPRLNGQGARVRQGRMGGMGRGACQAAAGR